MSIPKAAEPQFIPLNPSSPNPSPDNEEVEFLLQQFLGKIISKDFKEALELAQNGLKLDPKNQILHDFVKVLLVKLNHASDDDEIVDDSDNESSESDEESESASESDSSSEEDDDNESDSSGNEKDIEPEEK